MGEIDTKPIESVQTAITFFGQTNNEQRKNSPTYPNNNSFKAQEEEREMERESLERELASVKVQLEVKEAAHKHALLKLDHYHKTADELSTLLKNSDLKKNFYINESQKAGSRVTDLESALERMSYQLSEHEKVREQLETTQGEVALLREASTSQMQAMERLLSDEKLRNKELTRQISEANEAITHSETERIQIERSYAERLDCLNDLDNQMLEKSAYIESLQMEIKRADELRMSSERAASEAVSELSKLREEIELHETKSLDQASYIIVLEAEVEQIRREIEEANGEATRLKEHVVSVKVELEKAREQENEAQVEIALLKFQLHKGRSRLAAAEAAEARAQAEKTALYNALQQMGLEAEETKKENRMLKEEASKLHEEEEEEEGEDLRNEEQIYGEELEKTKRELEVAVSKIGELRTRAEQAISRAEAAEKAKAALEEEKRRRREQRERRKAALEALRQESISREFEIKIKDDDDDEDGDDAPAKSYQPLAKVLNMKF